MHVKVIVGYNFGVIHYGRKYNLNKHDPLPRNRVFLRGYEGHNQTKLCHKAKYGGELPPPCHKSKRG